jgi:hypothetical protein
MMKRADVRIRGNVQMAGFRMLSIKENTEKMLGKQDTTTDILRDVKDSLGVLTEIYRETLDLKDKYEKLSIDVEAIKTKLSMEV